MGEWSNDHTEFIKQYIIYYVHAPIWDMNDPEYVAEMRNGFTLEMTVDELLDRCMEYGLDPL